MASDFCTLKFLAKINREKVFKYLPPRNCFFLKKITVNNEWILIIIITM